MVSNGREVLGLFDAVLIEDRDRFMVLVARAIDVMGISGCIDDTNWEKLYSVEMVLLASPQTMMRSVYSAGLWP